MEFLIFPILYLLFVGFITIKSVSQKIKRDNMFFEEVRLKKELQNLNQSSTESLVDSHNIEHDEKIINQERKVARFSEFNRDYKTMADLHNVEHDKKILDQKTKVATYSEAKQSEVIENDEIVTEIVSSLQEDVLRGLIFAEIMSKPKALRK